MQNAALEVLYLPGSTAAISFWDLGQWFCTPPFREVCLFQVFSNCLTGLNRYPKQDKSLISSYIYYRHIHHNLTYGQQALCQCILLSNALIICRHKYQYKRKIRILVFSVDVVRYVICSLIKKQLESK